MSRNSCVIYQILDSVLALLSFNHVIVVCFFLMFAALLYFIDK
jgi:hypothetical protein